MSLSREEVANIAELARLELVEEQLDSVAEDLSRIIEFFAQLQAAPTADVQAMAHPLNMQQRLRADEVTETDQHERFQQNAPAVEAGLYLVPRVID